MLEHPDLERLRKFVTARARARMGDPAASRAFLLRAEIMSDTGGLGPAYRPTRPAPRTRRLRVLNHLARKLGQKPAAFKRTTHMR